MEHEIKPFKKNGKMWVTLEKNGTRKNHPLAVMVAEQFIPNPNKYKFVKHIDGNPENCVASNLYWSETE